MPLPACTNCGILLKDYRSTRCRRCSKLGVLHPLYGKHPTEETRRKRSNSLKGKHHGFKFQKGNKYAWKGGSWWYFHRQARRIMKVTNPNLIVHHRDRNFRNNHPSNLLVLTNADHKSLHNYENGECSEETKKKISKAHQKRKILRGNAESL
jgi:hypothetical protein